MVNTTLLQLPLLAASQAQKHVTHNEALLRLDGLVQLSALSYSVSMQPGAPSDGDIYLLPPGKTGPDWNSAANHAVAHYFDGVWHFYWPREGWLVYIKETRQLAVFDGLQWARLGLHTDARPVFFASKSANAVDKTGDGSPHTIVFDDVHFDTGDNYSITTGRFVAPIAGHYLLLGSARIDNLNADTFERGYLSLVTTGTTLRGNEANPETGKTNANTYQLSVSGIVNLNTGDDARIQVTLSGGNALADISGANATMMTYFSGALLS